MVMHPWEEDCIQIAQGFQDRTDGDWAKLEGMGRCFARQVRGLFLEELSVRNESREYGDYRRVSV